MTFSLATDQELRERVARLRQRLAQSEWIVCAEVLRYLDTPALTETHPIDRPVGCSSRPLGAKHHLATVHEDSGVLVIARPISIRDAGEGGPF